MKIYTVCHEGLGYVTHSYVWADSLESATVKANQEFSQVLSVMRLNKESK